MVTAAKTKRQEVLDDRVMTSVPKTMFYEGMFLPVSIFLKVSSGNYLTIGRKGDQARFSELSSFNDPGFLIYVQKVDHQTLVNFIHELSSKLIQQKNLPLAAKTHLLTGALEEGMASLEKKKFASAAQLQKVSKLLVELNESSGAFIEVLKTLQDMPSDQAKHPMATCLIALTLAEESHITHKVALESLALGALIHDVGLKFVPASILEKPRHLWNSEELQSYEQHPILGVEILREMKLISQDVLLIVAQHHETSSGTGYPKKLRDVKISPLAKIVGLADLFSELIFNVNPDSRTYTVDEAIGYIEDILGQPYNRGLFTNLKNIINKNHLSSQQQSG